MGWPNAISRADSHGNSDEAYTQVYYSGSSPTISLSSPPQKLSDHVLSEGERNPSIVLPPPYDVLIRVSPQQVAEQTGVWDIYGSRQERREQGQM